MQAEASDEKLTLSAVHMPPSGTEPGSTGDVAEPMTSHHVDESSAAVTHHAADESAAGSMPIIPSEVSLVWRLQCTNDRAFRQA